MPTPGRSGSVPTVSDVARKAGVSRSAVSYALNDGKSGSYHVSNETRTKVLQAAKDLGYQVDTAARALRKGYSEEIALIHDNPVTPFGADLLVSLQQQTLLHGYTLVIYSSVGLSPEQRADLHRRIIARCPIGLISASEAFSVDECAHALDMGVRSIVFLTFTPKSLKQTHSIVFPTREAGYLAARHLLERGHRRLALIRPEEASQQLAFEQRLDGMLAAIAGCPESTVQIISLSRSAVAANAAVEMYFVGDMRPTGVYAFNDEYAFYLQGALTRHSMRIPEQVALIGTDDYHLSEAVYPALTSIRFDSIDMGRRAIESILALSNGRNIPPSLEQPLVPQIIQREST